MTFSRIPTVRLTTAEPDIILSVDLFIQNEFFYIDLNQSIIEQLSLLHGSLVYSLILELQEILV